MFPTTHWSVVLAGGDATRPESQRALEILCRRYWYPIYAFARSLGYGRDSAEDLVQGFFAYLLEKKLVGTADPEKGRFRAFLKAAFVHYVANQHRVDRARRRGGAAAHLCIDVQSAESRLRLEPADRTTPEQTFERHWARSLLDRTLERLGSEMQAEETRERFQRLQPFLTGESNGGAYRQIGRELGMSEGAVKNAVLRLRRRFGRILREEVAHTVRDLDRVDAELRHLFAVLET